jgi:hypothetical protein
VIDGELFHSDVDCTEVRKNILQLFLNNSVSDFMSPAIAGKGGFVSSNAS